MRFAGPEPRFALGFGAFLGAGRSSPPSNGGIGIGRPSVLESPSSLSFHGGGQFGAATSIASLAARVNFALGYSW